ncbi:MAG: undecaprenyl/decaprenyl-phosphate alpha-N-acetylglucosaminyl 1-phosphate transferase [Chitinispirillia bacterium]|nr:undecaprenyl/decaprenyl-phosphate alpha-N-acetylglucosaminyl 1-phosphate transferase [Chitinispirillia bacterium]MCL2269288.1 undecaprenyl/decaprenyl-phosphate alpha-N-acetylglucosaminyl 1-phosphate transferase [Chitinispirillia bacterium]
MPGTEYAIIVALSFCSAVIASTAIQLILGTRLALLFADTPDRRKVHTAPIPRVGGIAMIAAVLAVTLVWYALSVNGGLIRPIPPGLFRSILAAATCLGVLGFLDDSKFVNIRVRHKIIVAAALALATVYIFGVHPGTISVFGLFVIPEAAGKVIAVLWIVGLINAYNLVDGLDGFAGTISILSLLGITAVSLLAGCTAAAVMGLFAVGAAVGFMVHNAPPARVFMGDTGSCFLGYMTALLTIRIAFLMDGSGKVPLIMPLLAAIPILEVIITILRRTFSANAGGRVRRTLRHIVTADNSHLHHRFLFRGFSHLETCILVGLLTTTIVGGAVCVMMAPISYMPWLAAYLVIPVATALYRVRIGGSLIAPICPEELARNIKLAAQRARTVRRQRFYNDFAMQVALAVPVFALLVYLLMKGA